MRSNSSGAVKKIFAAIGALIILSVVWIGVLTVTEYRPEEEEALQVRGSSSETISAGSEIRVMTWNIGYAGLSENADFFMDGGSDVTSCDKSQVQDNLLAVTGKLSEISPDIIYLQEVDTNSTRSYHINEVQEIADRSAGYQSVDALNYRCLYVPYPIPPIGQVKSGIQTLSRYELESAVRMSLPVPFSYPVRLANLKRCLLVSRIPLEDSDRELVLINLHLEAFDDGEGKEAQTQILRELIEKETDKGNYVIAGGDFNQTFSSTDMSAFPALEGDYWMPGYLDTGDFDSSLQFVTDSSVPTGRSLDQSLTDAESTDPSAFQYYVIDGFIVSDNISVENCETLDLGFKNSDHNPVVMTVTLN